MARLGELLVAAGLVTAEHVEQGLRAQVVWGGRLGTNLVELGHLDLDALARVLARQHRVPAALARHFDRADRALQSRFPAALAEHYAVVPLVRAGARKDHVAIAAMAPLDEEGVARIADAFGIRPARLVPSVAPELRIAYHLERVYRIPRELRFLRPRTKEVPAVLHAGVIPVPPESEPELVLIADTQETEPPPEVDTQEMPPRTEDLEEAMGALPIKRAPAELEPRPAAGFAFGSAPNLAAEAKAAAARGPIRTPAPRPVVLPIDRDDSGLLPIRQDLDTPPGDPMRDPSRDPATDPAADLGGPTIATPMRFEDSGVLSLPLDDLGDADEDPADPGGRERRKYVRTIADEPSSDSERQAVGRISLRRIAVAGAPGAAGDTLVEATRAIRRSSARDKVADLVMDAIDRFVPACDAAILLVKRGDVAIGWKGFSRTGSPLPEIAVPLDPPGAVSRAIEHGASVRLQASTLAPLDQLLLCSLGRTAGDLAIVPISIGGQVMCALALITAAGGDLEHAEPIAAAAGTAFARLMRDASR